MNLLCGQPLNVLLRLNHDAFLLWDAACFVDVVGQDCRVHCLAYRSVYFIFVGRAPRSTRGEGECSNVNVSAHC